jgi:hypothetical protein
MYLYSLQIKGDSQKKKRTEVGEGGLETFKACVRLPKTLDLPTLLATYRSSVCLASRVSWLSSTTKQKSHLRWSKSLEFAVQNSGRNVWLWVLAKLWRDLNCTWKNPTWTRTDEAVGMSGNRTGLMGRIKGGIGKQHAKFCTERPSAVNLCNLWSLNMLWKLWCWLWALLDIMDLIIASLLFLGNWWLVPYRSPMTVVV